jgi:hypothetical protein
MPVVPAGCLRVQQVALCIKTTGKHGQRAGSPHHAVARSDDRDRVAAIRGAHRAHGRGMADPARDLTIAAGLAKRDSQQGRPNTLLKFGALDVERNDESLQVSREVSSQLRPVSTRIRCAGPSTIGPRRTRCGSSFSQHTAARPASCATGFSRDGLEHVFMRGPLGLKPSTVYP